MVRDEADRAEAWLAELPPSLQQSWSAVAVAAVVLVGFGAVVPFAGLALAQLNAFFPALDAVVVVTGLITSVLLYAQFSISGSRALLALASGYLFTALIVIPHALTFAGAFSPNGLLGAGIQTGSWLFIFWHLGFAITLLAYAVVRKASAARPASAASARFAIAWSVASVCVLAGVCSWLATAGVDRPPPIILDETRISPIVVYPIIFTIIISAIAFVVLSTHLRSLLDQWLMVVALVLIAELIFSGLLPSVRFSVGFYAGRILSLLTSSIVLIVLLAETTRLYVRLANSNAMLQREKTNKLMDLEAVVAAIAHEVKQPLTGITARSSAARRLLRQQSPDIEKIKMILDEIEDAGFRADEVFENIRALFKSADLQSERIDINELVLEAVQALRGELDANSITVDAELVPNPPPLIGHKGQLKEVILNLIQNAIEAMQVPTVTRRLLHLQTEVKEVGSISLTVEDSGPGVAPEKMATVFTAFVTTKPKGLGLGLAICRMIAERHNGQLSASSEEGKGARFQLTLPVQPLEPRPAS